MQVNRVQTTAGPAPQAGSAANQPAPAGAPAASPAADTLPALIHEGERLRAALTVQAASAPRVPLSAQVFAQLQGHAQRARAEAVKQWLAARGFDVNTSDEKGDSLLHVAAACGRADLLADLVGAGALVNARSQFGVTPLHRAAWAGHVDAIKVLVDAGADLDARVATGQSPLELARSNNRHEALSFLVNLKNEREVVAILATMNSGPAVGEKRARVE